MEFYAKIHVQNIDVLKSRSRLFRKILCGRDNIDNSLVNVDKHINIFINELPTFIQRATTLIEINRNLVKDLGNKSETVSNFINEYPLSFLIVKLNYYECDELQEELVHSIAETPERCVTKIMKYLIELSANSNSIRMFVEKVNSFKLK